jgi:hypothetical protein
MNLSNYVLILLLFSQYIVLQMHDSIFSFSFILLFFIFISSIIIPLFLSSLRNKTPPKIPKPVSTRTHAPAILSPTDSHLNRPDDNDSTPTLFSKPASHDDPNQFLESGQCVMNDDMVERDHFVSDTRPELGGLDPFTSCSSVMQKKMKPQYDDIVKCNESKKLTLSQVPLFVRVIVIYLFITVWTMDQNSLALKRDAGIKFS